MIKEMSGDFLQWLRGFFFVAKTGSVSIAALEMGRNQSTISHQIRCLEDEFGALFFDRSKPKMELTPEGKILLEKTISIFELIKELKSELDDNPLQLEGKVVIAATHALILLFLPKFIVNFKKKYPNVNFDIEGGTLRMVLDKVKSAEADLGLVARKIDQDRIAFHELFETGIRLIAPKKNPFSIAKEPTLEQISELPFIIFPPSATLNPLIEKKFSEYGLKRNEILVFNNFEIIKKYVELGVGVSMIYDFMLEEKDEAKFDIFSMDHYFGKKKHGIIVSKRKYLSPAVKAFLKTIKPDIQLE